MDFFQGCWSYASSHTPNLLQQLTLDNQWFLDYASIGLVALVPLSVALLVARVPLVKETIRISALSASSKQNRPPVDASDSSLLSLHVSSSSTTQDSIQLHNSC